MINQDKLDKIISLVPAIQAPTISNLWDENWLALDVVIDEKTVRDIIPDLKKAGATGIVEYPLNKVIN